jgi:hypothetical protein
MRNDLVNLDALIARADFGEVRSNPEPSPAGLPEFLRLRDLVTGATSAALRKPDFQRETACWRFTRVAGFVRSFVEGDLIPAVILWRSPTTGKIFVVDGAHRLSALIAWVQDDYGDNEASLAYFQNFWRPEQLDAAQKTRELINNVIGSYEMLQAAAKNPEELNPVLVSRARNAETLPIPVLWMAGNHGSARR